MATDVILSGSSRFNVIDLNQLGRMYVLEDLDSELVIELRMQRFKQIWLDKDQPEAANYDVENLEFDPIRINQECNTYFEELLRDRVNQAARAITLPFAIGTDLDAIAARYPVGPRLAIVPTPRGTSLEFPEDYESDDRYRRRVQLSLNPTSPHGPSGAYMFWALTADPNLRDATEVAREGDRSEVHLTCMDDSTPVVTVLGDGSRKYDTEPRPNQQRILAIRAYILDAYRKAATDVLVVQPPKVVDIKYQINVWFYPPPDKKTLLIQIMNALEKLVVDDQRWLGFDHTRMAIFAALKQQGVHRAEIISPAEDVFVSPQECVRVTNIDVSYMGRSE
jgi:phage-related baseplate assembly protein